MVGYPLCIVLQLHGESPRYSEFLGEYAREEDVLEVDVGLVPRCRQQLGLGIQSVNFFL